MTGRHRRLIDVLGVLAIVAGCGGPDQGDPPVIISTPPATATEDVAYTYQAIVRDPDGPGAAWSLGRHHTCRGAIDAGGLFTFTPAGPLTEPSCVVSVQVCDGSLAGWCAEQSTTIIIEAVDDLPVIDSHPPLTAFEDQEYRYPATAFDPDGPDERPTWSLLPGHRCGGAIDPASGEFGFTPGDLPAGSCALAIQVCDGASPPGCGQQLATITIDPLNDAPVITSVAPTSVAEGAVYTYAATATDPDGPSAIWSSAGSCPGQIAPATGLYRFTAPQPNPPASCAVVVTVCDGGSPLRCTSQTTSVTIVADDDPPIASDDQALVFRRTVPTTLAVLANDLDVDGGPRSVAAVTQPAHGTVAIVAGDLTYLPAAGYCNTSSGGFDTFTYTLAPGNTVATVSVAVACAPVALPAVAAGDTHACLRRDDATVWCWGANDQGQLGDGTMIAHALPAPVLGGGVWASVESGALHTCGTRTDGTLWCWGNGDGTQIGDGTAFNRPSPVQVGGASDWTVVSGGAMHTCGVRADGTLWCWGWNARGQLGDGTNAFRPFPRQVGALTTWWSVSTGQDHSCGLRIDGTLWCWGDGQATPTRVGLASTWTGVNAGRYHDCATQLDGTLWCWGENGTGQVGDGTTIRRTSPVAVGGGVRWATVAGGTGHTCAIASDGGLWCWGANARGQLGDGTTTARLAPTRIGIASDWATVAAGALHTCAARVDGTRWCWGANDAGQLGDGTTTDRLVPTLVSL